MPKPQRQGEYNMKNMNNETINHAKEIVQGLFESWTVKNPVDFCRKVEEWYCSSKNYVPYKLRVAVLATAIVTGADMSESAWYAKPTNEAVRRMLPIVEKKMRKHDPLKIVCAEYDRWYMHDLFTDNFYAYTAQDSNVYHIDMHLDSRYEEVVA